jgi:hypothetical protein
MEILTMCRLFIKLHLNSRDDLLDNLCALLKWSALITVPMKAKNRNIGVLSKSRELLIEIGLSDNVSTALNSQPIGVFNNPLIFSQNLGRESDPRSAHYNSWESSMDKVSSGLLETSADIIPDCFRSRGAVVFSWQFAWKGWSNPY